MGLLHWLACGVVGGTVGAWTSIILLPLAYFTTHHRRNLMVAVCGIGIVANLWRSTVSTHHLWTQRWFGTITDTVGQVCAPADHRDRYTFLTICFTDPHTTVRAKTSAYTTIDVGDWVRVSGEINKPEMIDTFDYAGYLERYYIFGIIDRPTIERLATQPHTSLPLRLWRRLTELRHTIEQLINHSLPEPEASFLAGLLLGSRRLMPDNVLADLQRTGTTHIIAVSGANVVIIAGFVLYGVRFITHNTRLSYWLSLLIIWSFVVLTGISAAAVRGATVASFSLWASHARRFLPVATALLIPAAISVVINPTILHDIGWQLSYAAFFGILVVGPKITQHVSRLSLHPPSTFIETTAATLTTTPVSWWYFRTVSLSGLLVNPLILWLIPLATGCGALLVCMATFSPVLTTILRIPTTLILRSILTIVHLGSFIPLTWSAVP